jgi:hypothetical protein
MRGTERDHEFSAVRLVDDATEEGPALRDAHAVAARSEADEREAADVREGLREGALPVLDPDRAIESELRPGELVHDLRSSAMLSVPGDARALGYGGTLYLTSHRLIHVGQVTMNVQLNNILETSLAGERLLVTLREGEGLALDVDRPRTLRAEIAAALRGLRA